MNEEMLNKIREHNKQSVPYPGLHGDRAVAEWMFDADHDRRELLAEVDRLRELEERVIKPDTEPTCACGAAAVYQVSTMKVSGTGHACDDPTHIGELVQRLLSVEPRDAWSAPPSGYVTRRADSGQQ